MHDQAATIYVVDDDTSVRESLDSLFRSVNLKVFCYSSTRDVAFGPRPDWPSCIVCDVRMPFENGLSFHARLAREGISTPFVFLTGHGDVPMCAMAMKAGAVDFLLKPFREQDLLDAVTRAIENERTTRQNWAMLDRLRRSFETLAPRERQVMSLVVTGRTNKQIAANRTERDRHQGQPQPRDA